MVADWTFCRDKMAAELMFLCGMNRPPTPLVSSALAPALFSHLLASREPIDIVQDGQKPQENNLAQYTDIFSTEHRVYIEQEGKVVSSFQYVPIFPFPFLPMRCAQ